MRVFGGSIGVAISIIVLITRIQTNLKDILTPEQLANFYSSPLAIFTFSSAQQMLAREAFIDAFRIDMYICLGVSVASLFVSLLTYQKHPPSVKSRLDDLEAELSRSAALSGSSEV